MERTCPSCGATIESTAQFCPSCGARSEQAPPNPQTAPTGDASYGVQPPQQPEQAQPFAPPQPQAQPFAPPPAPYQPEQAQPFAPPQPQARPYSPPPAQYQQQQPQPYAPPPPPQAQSFAPPPPPQTRPFVPPQQPQQQQPQYPQAYAAPQYQQQQPPQAQQKSKGGKKTIFIIGGSVLVVAAAIVCVLYFTSWNKTPDPGPSNNRVESTGSSPSDDTQLPGDDTQSPSDDTQLPGDDTQSPSNASQPPIDASQPPIDASQSPPEESGMPGLIDNGESPTPPDVDVSAGPAVRLSQGIIDAIDSGIYSITMKLTGEGVIYASIIDLYCKNGMTCMVANFEGDEIRTIVKSGKLYYFLNDQKIALIYDATEEDERTGFTAGMVFIGEGTGLFDGVSYAYEEYIDADGDNVAMYMDGGTLKGLRLTSAGDVTLYAVLAFERSVADSVFEIPGDYTVMDEEEYYSIYDPDPPKPPSETEYYTLGNDRILSIIELVGKRSRPESGSSTIGGDLVLDYTYKTDVNDPTQAANDLASYITYLMQEEEFYNLVSFDGLPYEGGIDLSFAKESVDAGYIIIFDIKYDSSGYTFTIRKTEGTLTKY